MLNPATVRSRPEPFGAWLRLDEADALVAVDRPAARRMGIDGGALWGTSAPPPTRPLEVHVAVTARCPAGCEGCYLDATPHGAEPPRAAIEARLEAVARLGAFTVAFGGGEPMTRADLGELASFARGLGLVPVVTTSGIGLGAAKAATLRDFAQVNVSYDGVAEAYEAVRGYDGRAVAERALRNLAEAGVPAGVNMVLTRASFEALETTAAHVASLGARELQLLRYKPAGRAASLEYLARRLSPDQVAALHDAIGRVVARGAIAVRIDCALVPLLSASITEERARALEAFGVFGCEAARHLAAVRNDGLVAPCSFAEPTATRGEAIERGWDGDVELAAWRRHHASPAEPCASCPVRRVCRGGCQIVSRHLGGGFGPDPECPRVRASAEPPRGAQGGKGA